MVQKQLPVERADDLIQGFLTSEVLERHLIRRADRARGRFRALLMTALNRYILRDLRRRRAQKREVDRAVSLDDEKRTWAQPASRRQSDAFDIAWARRVIDQTLTGMRSECDSAGRNDLWMIFEARILAPALDGIEPVSYELLVDQFSLATPKQAANAVVTGRRMFVRHLREVVAQYTLAEGDIDQEIRDLQQCLAQNSSSALRSR